MSLHLVTGIGATEHIEPNDDAGKHIGIFGTNCVLKTGRMFEAEQVSNNLIRIHDGNGIFQGRHFDIKTNDYIEIEIDNGLQALKRNDLIVFRYQKNVDTKIESLTPLVMKGVSGDTAVDPEYINGDISNGDVTADCPMYRIVIDGLNITAIEPLFNVILTIKELKEITDAISNNIDLLEEKTKSVANQIPTDNISLKNGAGYITSKGSCQYANTAGAAETATRATNATNAAGCTSTFATKKIKVSDEHVDSTSNLILQSAHGYGNYYRSGKSGGHYFQDEGGNYTSCTASSFTQASSRRVKENIKPMKAEEAKKILDINVVGFDYIEEIGGQKNNYGFIAEDVENQIPYIVIIPDNYDENNPDLNEVPAIDYSRLVPHLTKMIQIQNEEIKKIKNQLSSLEEKE